MSRTPTGRVALAPADWKSRLLLSLAALLPAALFAELAFRAAAIFADGLPFGVRILMGLACAAAAFGGAVVMHAIAHPTPVADFDTARLVVGALSIPFTAIDEARLLPSTGRGAASRAILRFGRAKTSSARAVLATVPIESAGRGRHSDLRRAALLVVLDASSIRMPADRYDPTGRFAEYNFPDHLDRARAIQLIESACRDDGTRESGLLDLP